MSTLILDPNPKNELGKGIFSPECEAELLADGYVFAYRHLPTKDRPFLALTVCKRFIADAVTDQELSDPYRPRSRVPTPMATA